MSVSVHVCPRLQTDHQTSCRFWFGRKASRLRRGILLDASCIMQDIQTLSCSIWDEVIQFWPYRSSLMTEGKLNCLSISPAPPLPLRLFVSLLFLLFLLHIFPFAPLSHRKPSFSKTPVLCLLSVLSVYVSLPAVISCTQRAHSLTVWYVKKCGSSPP